jgi:hypothetical protein
VGFKPIHDQHGNYKYVFAIQVRKFHNFKIGAFYHPCLGKKFHKCPCFGIVSFQVDVREKVPVEGLNDMHAIEEYLRQKFSLTERLLHVLPDTIVSHE